MLKAFRDSMHLNRHTILFRGIMCVCVCVYLLNLGCVQLLGTNHAALHWHSRMAWSRAIWKASLRCTLSSAVSFLSLILSPLFLYSFICQVRDCQREKKEHQKKQQTLCLGLFYVLPTTLLHFQTQTSIKVSPCRKVFPGSGFTRGKQLWHMITAGRRRGVSHFGVYASLSSALSRVNWIPRM